MVSCYFSLYKVLFIGSLPQFPKPLLKIIKLNSNDLTGQISNQFNPNVMIYFTAEGNHFTGPLPTTWCLSTARFLSSNQFVGTIPSCYQAAGNLHLFGNSLTGTIPSLLMTNPSNIQLCQNDLVGSIPSQLDHGLTYLCVGFNNLIGTIPPFKMPYRSMRSASVYQNSLTGILPAEWVGLKSIDARYNMLDGSLPRKLLSPSSPILSLLMNANMLTSTILGYPSSGTGKRTTHSQYSVYRASYAYTCP